MLVLLAVLGGVVLIAFAGNVCPADAPGRPCPTAGVNRAIVVALAAVTAGLAVAPFALLAEFARRRSIIFRGAWGRAARRGLLVAGVVAAIGALRLGGAISVPVVLFLISVAAATEWLAIRRFDPP
jgi:hypothetical protein